MANENRFISIDTVLLGIQTFKRCYEEKEKELSPAIVNLACRTLAMVEKFVKETPPAEVEPVVHAYWELYNINGNESWKIGWRCSHCKGYRFHDGGMLKKYTRCPNCGAHMDLKEADHG